MKRVAGLVFPLVLLLAIAGCGGGSGGSDSSGSLRSLAGTWGLAKVTVGTIVINCPGSANLTPDTVESCSPSQHFAFTSDGHYALYITDPSGIADENGTYTFNGTILQTVAVVGAGFHTTTYTAAESGNQIGLAVISSNGGTSTILAGQTWSFQLQ